MYATRAKEESKRLESEAKEKAQQLSESAGEQKKAS
jgi:hypothetical protein